MPYTYTTKEGYTFTSPTTNELNGNMDVPATAKDKTTTTKRSKTDATIKAVTTPTAPPPTPVSAATTTVASTSVPSKPKPASSEFNVVSDFIAPLLTVLLLVFIFLRLLMYNTKKHPINVGFAHHHKHMHPGRPKLNAFKKHK
jgi:hypothetical protein